MLAEYRAHALDAPFVGREPRRAFIGQARNEFAQRKFLPVGETARPILHRLDELILALLEALFLRLGKLFPHLIEALLDTRLDEVDLVVSKSRHDRGRFVDDACRNDVEKRIDLAFHPEQLLLSQAFRDCGIDRSDQHVDLAAERRRSSCNGPVNRGTCRGSLRLVEIELYGNLSRDPAGADVLEKPGAPHRNQ